MKVLLTHELFMPDFAGGGEKLAYEMAKHLIASGVEVTVLTTGDPKITEFEGIPTIRLPINRFTLNTKAKEIARVAKDFDLIQTCTYHAAYPSYKAGRIAGKPVVCMVFGMYGKRWVTMRGPLLGTAYRHTEKFILSRPYDRMIFLSDYSRKWGEEAGIQFPPSTVIHPGVDTGLFSPKEKEPFVLFSGRFATQKGVDDVIAVARKLPSIKFVMMGWGEEETRLRRDAPRNVEFSGLRMKDGQKYFDMYGKALVFFLPSVAESFGFTIVEAMSAGCTIVSTIDLPFKGRKVVAGEPSQMAVAISDLFDDQKKTAAMGAMNVKRAKDFNWESFTQKLITVYQEVLS